MNKQADRAGTAPPAGCGHPPPHADTSPRALQANPFATRWAIIIALLVDPAGTARALGARLERMPVESRRHACWDEPEPRRGRREPEIESEPRSLSPLACSKGEEVSQNEPTAEGSR